MLKTITATYIIIVSHYVEYLTYKRLFGKPTNPYYNYDNPVDYKQKTAFTFFPSLNYTKTQTSTLIENWLC